MTNNIQGVEIFSYIAESRRDKLEALFSLLTYDQGASVIKHGEPVNGLYILNKGEVEVLIPGFEGVLATLDEGRSFGEMSLFSSDDLASATVSVKSITAELLFCPRDLLTKTLVEDELLAAGFYHGCAQMVAERLRTTNKKISSEIAKSINMASLLIQEISTSGNLGVAQEELITTGSSIVSGMTKILQDLLVMKQTGEPVPHEDIARLADSAREIYYSEFQVFEKVARQLQYLGQHLDNVSRILSQQDVIAVDDDVILSDFP